jgi:serine/threonine protein kinase
MAAPDPTTGGPAATAEDHPAAAGRTPGEAPRVIGSYHVLERLGEGGMGEVWLAEQDEPIQRLVAIKLIKTGMDTLRVVARFEQERQALAIMDHPNIASVLDAGTTPSGSPYFVMELVKGEPIVDYCDRNHLNLNDRLALFAQVCQAVQHAHGKGIIHRDLKPSNILVATQEGRPCAKVIDFGIAKATLGNLTDKTLFTAHGGFVGTLEYMSPEQAEGSMDIDTRTDVYSLGVVFYELLTGTTPFGSQELRSAAPAELQRILREVEPPTPSVRIARSGEGLASLSAKRRTEPLRLASLVRGELDWIAMKAMEKNRERRYETASELALDLHRYLSGEAVLAAPPSSAYRFKKFLRRNRVLVSAGSAVAGALLVGMLAAARQAHVAGQERDRAAASERAAKEARGAAEDNARLAEAQATLALGTIQQLVGLARTELTAPGTSSFRKSVLDLALANVSRVSENYQKSTSKEATAANIHSELGQVFLQLGQSEKAAAQFEKTMEIAQVRVKVKNANDPSRQNLAVAHYWLAESKAAVGRDMQAVLAHQLEALRLWQEIHDQPKLDGFQLGSKVVDAALADSQQRAGVTLYRLGDLSGAVTHFQEALALREGLLRAAPGDDSLKEDLTFSFLAAAEASFRLGDNERARGLFQSCLELRESLAAASPTSPSALGNLAAAHLALGDFALRTGALDLAAKQLDRSRQLRQGLVEAEPERVDLQRDLALSHALLGSLWERRGDAAAAARAFATARTLAEKLARADPANERRQVEWMNAMARAGEVPGARALAARFDASPSIDNELRTELAACYARCAKTLWASDKNQARVLRSKALGLLRAASANGYSDRVSLATDPDLSALSGDPEFVALLKDLGAGAHLPQPR